MIRVIGYAIVFSAFATANAQSVSSNPRETALRYALEHGFEVPDSGVVVVIDGEFGMAHKPAVVPTRETQSGQATGVARVLSSEPPVALGKDVLLCRGLTCIPSGQSSVLLVRDPETIEDGIILVGVRLFSRAEPGSEADGEMRYMTVEVRRGDRGWTAVRVVSGPAVSRYKLPPPR